MKLRAIASGSNGNCFYVEEGDTRILIDAGVSQKKIVNGLAEIGVKPEDLTALLVTHEHSDHILAVPDLALKYDLPVFATQKTAENTRLRSGGYLSDLPRFTPITPGIPFQAGGFTVRAVKTHHDTAEPVFFRLDGEKSFALLTDTGTADPEMIAALKDLDAVLLESNHDERMLEAGRYPYALKRRVLGLNGHLSNEAALEILDRILSPRLKLVFFGHVSEENNYPDLIRVGADAYLAKVPAERKHPELVTVIATRTEATELYEI